MKELARTKSGKHRKKLERRLSEKGAEFSAHPYIHVGKHMDASELHRHFLAEDAKSWRSIMKRFMVRGHWRQQPCGIERSERRLVWIQPYWKGPVDISEVISRPYIVD